MFAMRGASDLGRKRGRDGDDDDDGTSSGGLSFGEHRTKRLQCLPLRTSPSSQPVQKRWSAPSFPPTSVPATSQPHTITPGDSDSEEAQHRQQQPASHFSPWSSSPTPSDPPGLGFSQSPSDADDMMMDVTSPTSSSMHQGHDAVPTVDNLEPGPFHPEAIASTIAGRMPTPIQPSFSAQVRGVWGGPGPALNYQQHPNGVHNMGHQHDSMLGADDPTVPRTLDAANAEWMGVHSRRLPSPISEGEDMCSPTASAGLASPGMVLDAGGNGMSDHLNACLHMHRRESFGAAIPREVGMMDVEDAEPGMATTTLTQTMSAPAEPNSAPATPSPGRKGHIRSRHTVNSWTWQPGMKKSFSIGYRADCEKCRMKVPGHFNHIIIS